MGFAAKAPVFLTRRFQHFLIGEYRIIWDGTLASQQYDMTVFNDEISKTTIYGLLDILKRPQQFIPFSTSGPTPSPYTNCDHVSAMTVPVAMLQLFRNRHRSTGIYDSL